MFESILFVGDLSHQWSRSHARLDALRTQLPNAKIDEVNWNKNSCIGSFIIKAYLIVALLSFLRLEFQTLIPEPPSGCFSHHFNRNPH